MADSRGEVFISKYLVTGGRFFQEFTVLPCQNFKLQIFQNDIVAVSIYKEIC